MPIDSTSEENAVVHPSIGTYPIIDSPGFPNDENMVYTVFKKRIRHIPNCTRSELVFSISGSKNLLIFSKTVKS